VHRRAIAVLLTLSAAANTIRARSTIRACTVGRVNATNAVRSSTVNTIWYGLVAGTGMFCQPSRRHGKRHATGDRALSETVPKPPPASTKTSLRQRLTRHAEQRWPALTPIQVRHHGVFAYVDGQLPGGVTLPLFRLRHGGSASTWGFAIYLASRDGYENSILPSGLHTGSPEEALDCACGLYLNDPTAWLTPPTN
jgi:hypothetical protein